MPSLTFVIGLCGSGKTWHAERLQAETGAKLFEGVVEKKQFPEVIECLLAGDNCIVEEISFCDANNRQVLVGNIARLVPGVEIKWVCLENDLEAANWNVV